MEIVFEPTSTSDKTSAYGVGEMDFKSWIDQIR